MKITIVCDVLGEPNNGTSIAAYNLINTLKNKGHQVKILCPDEYKKGEPGYYVLPHLNLGVFNNYVNKNGVTLAKKDEEVLEAACHDADIIHCMMPFSAGKMAAKYAKKHNIPLSCGFHVQAENITAHLHAMNSRFANKETYIRLRKRMYRYAYSIHYPTQFICDYVKKYKIKAPHEYVISNGVNKMFHPMKVEKPEAFKDRFMILMSGRYSKEKNQQMLIKAVGRSKYNDKIQIVLAGGGPREKQLMILAEQKLVNRPVFILADRPKLAKIINMCDLYVHTSKIEIEAISCLEALSCGLVPVISDSKKSATSKFALIPESKFKWRSVRDLTKKIEYWIEHPEKRLETSKMYVEFAKQFDFDLCMDRMEKMLIDDVASWKKEHESQQENQK